MILRLAITASFAILVFPTSGAAQTDEPGPVRQAVIESLQDSEWVRLTATDLGRRQGRLLAHGPSELVLSADPEPRRVPTASVDTLWTRGTSTIPGGIAGALLGLGLGVLAATQLGETDTDRTALWAVSLGAGTVGGGFVGALVGTAIPRWKRRHP
jgi:hypothetical protein